MFKFIKTIDQNLQNKINKSIVFNYLRDNQPVSRAAISRALGISPSAVSRLIGDLIDNDYVLEFEKKKTNIGKRPTLLKINSNLGCIVALDLSQSYLKLSVNNFSSESIEKINMFKISNDINIIDKITIELEKIFVKSPTTEKLTYKNLEVKAISLGIPANIDIVTGEIKSASLYDKWYSINFKTKLEKKFNVPVFAEKDVYLSLFAEKHYGQGKDFSDVVFVEISNGVSCGIIVDNDIIRGKNLSAGEISFMVLDNKFYEYTMGDTGFLDKNASFQSFREKYIERVKYNGKSNSINSIDKDLSSITTNKIFEAANEGDKVAIDVIFEIADLIAKAIVNIILILDTQIVVLGGNITNCASIEEIFIDRIKEKIRRVLPIQEPIITISKLKEDVVLIGASIFAINAMIHDIFPYKV